tara:strand:- start:366 stop:5054 length:4689 start_codon:yes stop_codon:yes gene_type:complete
MAKNTVLIEFQIVQKGKTISVVQKETEKLAKTTDKAAGANKRQSKSQEDVIKGQKGIHQSNLSSAKGFSKMNQMLGSGGSSGLVAAYATLAANVFAASAAFLALRNAAQFEQLQQGIEQLGAQSGRTLSVMAQGLRDVTGGAISAQQAMTGAALGVSGGFGAPELEGLAKIARGASITLGRDLADAFDRLTRGAIKLEPEILDELGIMVRLDEAVDNYAAQIGKTAGALSQAERRQAFMNAILEQGEQKFGAIAEAVEPTAYDKLGATFADLTKDIFSFVNETLGLEKLVGFLAENVVILAGVMVMFGSTIVGTMLPGLANAAAGASATAEKLQIMAAAQLEAADAAVLAGRAQLGQNLKLMPKAYKDIAVGLDNAADKTAFLQGKQKTLNASLAQMNAIEKRGAVSDKARHQAKVAALNTEILLIERQIILEKNKGKAAQAAAVAEVKADSAKVISDTTTLFTAGALSFSGAAASIFANMKDEIELTGKAATAAGANLGFFSKAMIKSSAAGTAFVAVLRIVGATLLSFALPIGIIIALIGGLIFAFRKVFRTEEVKKYNKGQEELAEILDSLDTKAEAFAKSLERAQPVAAAQITQFSIISGVFDEINTKLEKQIKLRKEANESRPGSMSEGLNERNAELAASAAITAVPGDQGAGVAKALGIDNKTFIDALDINGIIDDIYFAFRAVGGDSNLLPDGLKAMDDLKEGITGLFQIKDTPELQSFIALLDSDIPVIAKILKQELDLRATIRAGAKVTKEQLAEAIDNANERTKLLGASVSSVNAQLKAGEKQAGSFLRSLSPKTPADEIIKVVDGIITEVNTLNEQMKLAFTDEDINFRVGEIGKSLSATGAQMAKLMGNDFQEDLKRVRVAEKAINDAKIEGVEVTQAQKDELDAALVVLGGHEQSYKDTSDTLKTIQRQTIERKGELENINKILKTASKFEKLSVQAANLRNVATAKQLEGEKEITQAYKSLVEGTFSAMKDTEGFIAKFSDGETSLKEILEIAKAEGVAAEDVFTFRKLIREEKEQELQTTFNLATAQANMDIAEAKATQHLISLKREENKEIEKAARLQAEINSFNRTGSTDISGAREFDLIVQSAKKAAEFAEEEKQSKLDIIKAETVINKAKVDLLKAQMIAAGIDIKASGVDFDQMKLDFDTAEDFATSAVEKNVENLQKQVVTAIMGGFTTASEQAAQGDTFGAYTTALKAATEAGGPGKDITDPDTGKVTSSTITTAEAFGLAQVQMQGFAAAMEGLGPEGEKYQAFIGGMSAMASMVQVFGDTNSTAAEKVKAVSGTLSAIGSAIMASSKAQSAEIQNQIDMEEKRDGKSAKSLAKIKALKAKQTAIERKAFEQNKKIQLASAVINGMAAIQSGYATQPFMPLGLAMGTLAVAMTAMQIKAIKSQTFQGGEQSTATPPSALSIGSRDNKVDVSRGATSGELSYLRGQRGVGSNANNFAPGGAAGMKRSYAAGGEILVGERGPEVIQPTTAGFNVIPNDQLGTSQNINFNINAVDATGVQELLVEQRGNIIEMIREAANDTGEFFLEDVDTQSMGGSGGGYG